jgi:uncharacterized membrane protein YecN with MAPEG domain
MTSTIPLITALTAAVLGLLGALLTANVIINRVRTGINAGDGGAATLAQAIRAHGNFVEQAPLTLILLGIGETIGVRPLVVGLVGALLIAARLASAYGLNRSLGASGARQFGGGMSVVLPAAISIAILLALGGIR